MNTIIFIFHKIAECLYFINPIVMAASVMMWSLLYSRINKQTSKLYHRCYVLERQVDLLLMQSIVDKRDIEMIERLRKMHE